MVLVWNGIREIFGGSDTKTFFLGDNHKIKTKIAKSGNALR